MTHTPTHTQVDASPHGPSGARNLHEEYLNVSIPEGRPRRRVRVDAFWIDETLNEVQERLWQPKPFEELYDVVADPHQILQPVSTWRTTDRSVFRRPTP